MVNPLNKYFRKPAISISLPTQGEFYAPGALTFDNDKELNVFPMTARDEMMMNSPDALMNSSATIDVIKSCVPGIRDPWSMPVIDLDTVLLGVRIASLGESMDISVIVPKVEETIAYTVDLRVMMDQIDRAKFDPYVVLEPTLTVKVKPMSYRQLTNLQLRTYEQQRMITQVAQGKMSASEKNKEFNEIFNRMTNLTLDNMKEAVLEINADGDVITENTYISEFVDNMQAEMASKIRTHIDSQNSLGKIKPITVQVPEDMVKKGAPTTFGSPLSLDNSNFFVRKS